MTGVLATPVELTVPCDSRWMRLVRLTASGVAVACGLPLDETEDFRLVVDEVCGALMEACAPAAAVHIAFAIAARAITVEGSTRADPLRDPDEVRGEVGRQILGVLASSHRLTRDGDRLALIAVFGLRSGGVG
jgi:serine/threonine-protein kinase RsbW